MRNLITTISSMDDGNLDDNIRRVTYKSLHCSTCRYLIEGVCDRYDSCCEGKSYEWFIWKYGDMNE